MVLWSCAPKSTYFFNSVAYMMYYILVIVNATDYVFWDKTEILKEPLQ